MAVQNVPEIYKECEKGEGKKVSVLSPKHAAV